MIHIKVCFNSKLILVTEYELNGSSDEMKNIFLFYWKKYFLCRTHVFHRKGKDSKRQIFSYKPLALHVMTLPVSLRNETIFWGSTKNWGPLRSKDPKAVHKSEENYLSIISKIDLIKNNKIFDIRIIQELSVVFISESHKCWIAQNILSSFSVNPMKILYILRYYLGI